MSGQQSKGGQQQYGAPSPGNPYYMDQNSLYNRRGLQSGMGGMMPATDMGMGGGYFSMGNSMRMSPMFNNQSLGPNGNTSLTTPYVTTPYPANPFQGAPGGGGFSMPGMPNLGPIQGNPFQGTTPADFGPTNPGTNFSQMPTALQGNVDPNSPQYAAYYNSLPASTRAYMSAPGSANANFRYQDQLTHPGSFFS